MTEASSNPTGLPDYRKIPEPKWRHTPAAADQSAHFVIDYQHIDAATAKAVLEHAEAAFEDVTSALKDFDRANADKTITIFVRDKIGLENVPNASSTNCQINIPARFLVPNGAQTGPVALRGRGPTLWHNIVHVCYPPKVLGADPGTLKFYCEGLGGYMQAEHARAPSKWPPANYPTMGLPLAEAVALMMEQYGVLSLKDCWHHIGGTAHSPERRLAWLEAASYVQYLMRKNARAFVDVYCGRAPFQTGFGNSESDLWQDWLKTVEDYISENFEPAPEP